MTGKDSLAVSAVADRLDISEELVRRRIKQKKLPGWTRPLCNRQWLVCSHFVNYLVERGRPPFCAFLTAPDGDLRLCRNCTARGVIDEPHHRRSLSLSPV